MQRFMIILAFLALTACGGSSGGNDEKISPDTSTPDTSISDTRPDTSTPDTIVPDTSIPDTTPPDISTPNTSTPEVSTPSSVMSRAYTYTGPLGKTTKVPKQSLVSYLDKNKLLHMAWVEEVEENDHRLKYATYNQDGTFSKVNILHEKLGLIFAIAMVVEDNSDAHIVMQAKRDIGSNSKSGNYAVYYSGNSSGSFSSNQVSNNPKDPLDNTTTIFDANVNGRPDIFIDRNGAINILFTAAPNSITSSDEYAILAKKQGNSWNKTQLFNMDDINSKTYPSDRGISVSRKSSIEGPFVWMDFSDYHIHAVQSAVNNELSGYGDYPSVTDVQSIDDENGKTYAVWLRDKDDDITGNDYAFYISEITAAGLQNPIRIPINSTNVTSNFAPAAIDPLTGKFYLLYTEDLLATETDRHLIEYDPATDNSTETTLPQDIGTPYGTDSLWVYDGLLTFVAADSWNEIRINHMLVNKSTETNQPAGFKTFPDDFLNASQNKNINLTGVDINNGAEVTTNFSSISSGTATFNSKEVQVKINQVISSVTALNLGAIEFYYDVNNGSSLEGFKLADGTTYFADSALKLPSIININKFITLNFTTLNGASAEITFSTQEGISTGREADRGKLLLIQKYIIKDSSGVKLMSDEISFIIDSFGVQELIAIIQTGDSTTWISKP